MFTYQHGGNTYSVQIERLPDSSYRAVLGERVVTFSAEAIEHGWSLGFPETGARQTVYVDAEGDTRSVSFEGERYSLVRETARAGRRAAAHGSGAGRVEAQMPGQVREVLVKEGDTVTRGQVLLILEAMKMELRATAPVDGTVRAVLAAVGDVVTRGQPLIEIDNGDND